MADRARSDSPDDRVVERVARALWHHDQQRDVKAGMADPRYRHEYEPWERAHALDQKEYRERACAAVDAL